MPTVSVVKINSSAEQVSTEEERFEIGENQTIFDAAEEENITMPHGCLAGSCGSCRVYVLEGAENINPPSLIEENTIKSIAADYREKDPASPFTNEKKIRLSCRAKINGKGNIKVSPFK